MSSEKEGEKAKVDVHLPDGAFRRLIDDHFLQYASYVIRERAIPQVEDGLKPVQRRILHALHEKDDGRFNKVANVAGNCMQYHPHGNVSIEDALVGLANKRYLIEGQGNFGNIFTGDRAAASRYIECRLTPLARNEVFHYKITEMVPSYDGRNKEPVVFPCKLPLLLMLGTEGIAVGLSTSILPHNFIELLKAQIAILKGKRFKVLPDFIQGGIMDASEYDKGRGKVKVRAVIDKVEKNKLLIREIAYGTTTESLIKSIEDAVRKKKIKIRSINDFTAEKVEILLTLVQGENQDKVIQALYHFTQCEVSANSSIVVMEGERPREMTVDEVLEANTAQLLDICKRELELKQRELGNELHFKSLVQFFIENRIYKRIENAETYEKVQQAVLKGLAPFRKKLTRDITLDDVEMLLDLRIKRISKFDLQKNQDDIAKIVAELKEVAKYLRNLKGYATGYLEGLIKTYGKEYKRRTKTGTAEDVDVRKLTAHELGMVYDREKGFLGYEVKGEASFRCSPMDKILVVWKDGRYQVMSPPDKLFVNQDVLYFDVFDRDRVFTLVYGVGQVSYIKRFAFGGVVMNKEYQCAQEKAKILLFTEREVKQLYVRFRKSKGLKILEHTFSLADVPVRGAKAKGNQLTKKSISSVKAVS